MLRCSNCCLMQNCKMAGQVCGDFMPEAVPDIVIDWTRYIYTRKEVAECANIARKIWPDCSDASMADYVERIKTILVLDIKKPPTEGAL